MVVRFNGKIYGYVLNSMKVFMACPAGRAIRYYLFALRDKKDNRFYPSLLTVQLFFNPHGIHLASYQIYGCNDSKYCMIPLIPIYLFV